MRHLLLAAAALAVLSTTALATDYEIDTAHTQVGFKAKHVLGKVPGRFTKFSGTFSYDPKDVKSWKADVTIDPASITTDNEARDKHLKSAAFFDVEKCPAMSFKSTSVDNVKGDHFTLHGTLMMHCVPKPVDLDVEVNGVAADPWGNATASFSATGHLNRHDWGVDFDKKLDQGGYLIGDNIDLELEVSGNVKKAAAPVKK